MAALRIFGKPKKKKVSKKPPQARVVSPEKAENQPAARLGDLQMVRPHITEKATSLASQNQYVFVVKTSATKKEIERDVERRYGVHVEKTRIVTVHKKRVRLGRTPGIKKGYKKAIVQIQKGQKIEIMPT